MTAASPPPTPTGAGRRTLFVILSVVLSSFGALFAVIFTPISISGLLQAEPLDGAWNEGSNAINVVFTGFLGFGMLLLAVFPIAGAILGRLAGSSWLIVFGVVVAAALAVAGVCGVIVSVIWGSGS
jgi:hypothetical protein